MTQVGKCNSRKSAHPGSFSLARDVLRAGCGIASRSACQTLPPVDSDPRTWQTVCSGAAQGLRRSVGARVDEERDPFPEDGGATLRARAHPAQANLFSRSAPHLHISPYWAEYTRSVPSAIAMGRIRLAYAISGATASAVVLLAAQQQFPTAPTPQNPIFRAGATLVAVDVYPTRDGHIVEGLTPADFQVDEDGKPQSVEFFEFLKFDTHPPAEDRRDPQTAEEGERLVADPHHRAFVAYFDVYHLTVAGARNMRQPIIEFLDRTIGPTDYFAALNPDTPISSLTFGQRMDTISNEVDRYWPQAATASTSPEPLSSHEEFLQACYGQRYPDASRNVALVRARYRRWRTDLVLNSLRNLTGKLATIREERTDVLLFADGWSLGGPDSGFLVGLWHVLPQPGVVDGRFRPNGALAPSGVPDPSACDAELSRLEAEDFAEDFRRLLDEALRRNVAFYAIEPDGMAVFDDQLMMTSGRPKTFDQGNFALEPLQTLAANTNGQSIVRQNDIRTPMLQLVDAMSAYYLLGYYTTNTKLDGKYRTIDVKVKKPGVHVTARHGYTASPNPVVTRSTSTSGASSL